MAEEYGIGQPSRQLGFESSVDTLLITLDVDKLWKTGKAAVSKKGKWCGGLNCIDSKFLTVTYIFLNYYSSKLVTLN